jgi:hypothetical protein
MVVMLMNKDAFDQKLDEFFRNYQDSGMKKWSGFFLSDHTVKISKSNIERNTKHFKKSEMPIDKISEILLDSFCNHKQVSLQLKELDENGNLSPDIKGFVEGYYDQETIIVSGSKLSLETINHVQIIS